MKVLAYLMIYICMYETLLGTYVIAYTYTDVNV